MKRRGKYLSGGKHVSLTLEKHPMRVRGIFLSLAMATAGMIATQSKAIEIDLQTLVNNCATAFQNKAELNADMANSGFQPINASQVDLFAKLDAGLFMAWNAVKLGDGRELLSEPPTLETYKATYERTASSTSDLASQLIEESPERLAAFTDGQVFFYRDGILRSAGQCRIYLGESFSEDLALDFERNIEVANRSNGAVEIWGYKTTPSGREITLYSIVPEKFKALFLGLSTPLSTAIIVERPS